MFDLDFNCINLTVVSLNMFLLKYCNKKTQQTDQINLKKIFALNHIYNINIPKSLTVTECILIAHIWNCLFEYASYLSEVAELLSLTFPKM